MVHIVVDTYTDKNQGNDFDGTAILGKYRGPDMTFGDAGIRKHMQRVIVNFAPESTIDADLFLRYDYEAKDSARPAAYELDSADIAAIYGTTTYGSSSTKFWNIWWCITTISKTIRRRVRICSCT